MNMKMQNSAVAKRRYALPTKSVNETYIFPDLQ